MFASSLMNDESIRIHSVDTIEVNYCTSGTSLIGTQTFIMLNTHQLESNCRIELSVVSYRRYTRLPIQNISIPENYYLEFSATTIICQ